MPDAITDRKIFSLFAVSKSIQKTLSERYSTSFWVKAEMNKLNHYTHSGHCYPDLVEKKDGRIITQMRSILWKTDYLRIDKRFQEVLKEPLKDGVKILFLARISYTPEHGLSLVISDIDPSFTLGDLEREKQDTIKRLQVDGIFHKNKTLQFPLLPQRIAIISVETSKGYADFIKVIDQNQWGYKFFLLLFPALLQGDKAAERISFQLRQIEKVKHHFDVVVIIRGGGGEVGLTCYNDYYLAKEIANFPIPVLTGIGHATNETVAEMVAYSNAITPSKLAVFLLEKFHNFSVPVLEAEKKLTDRTQHLIEQEKRKFQSEIKLFRSVTENILSSNQNYLQHSTKTLMQQARYLFRNEKLILESSANTIRKDSFARLNQFKLQVFQISEKLHSRTELKIKNTSLELNNIENNISNMNPKNVLKRGYSITRINGKAIKNISEVKKGEQLTTLVYNGEIQSTVDTTKTT